MHRARRYKPAVFCRSAPPALDLCLGDRVAVRFTQDSRPCRQPLVPGNPTLHHQYGDEEHEQTEKLILIGH